MVNIDRYDLILGTPWLIENQATLNFKDHTVQIGDYTIQAFMKDEDAAYEKTKYSHSNGKSI